MHKFFFFVRSIFFVKLPPFLCNSEVNFSLAKLCTQVDFRFLNSLKNAIICICQTWKSFSHFFLHASLRKWLFIQLMYLFHDGNFYITLYIIQMIFIYCAKCVFHFSLCILTLTITISFVISHKNHNFVLQMVKFIKHMMGRKGWTFM